jgi:hypothetical protein
VDGKYGPGDLVPAAGNTRVAVRVLGPSWAQADRVELYANGRKIRESPIPASTKAGVKWSGDWLLPRFSHDTHLAAIASGPAVRALYLPIARPYQATSSKVELRVIGASGAVWIDADRDGQRPALTNTHPGWSSTMVLPIADFLAAQSTTAVFTPPVRDQLGWGNSAFDPGTTSSDPSRFMLVDYTGQAAQYLLQHGINLHTAVTGYVTETAIGTSGQIEVSVNLEATNALTWVANIANINPSQPNAVNTAPLELGYRAQDLVANPSLKPALSDVHLQITFQEQAGAPLADLAAAFTEGMAPPGFSERLAVCHRPWQRQ